MPQTTAVQRFRQTASVRAGTVLKSAGARLAPTESPADLPTATPPTASIGSVSRPVRGQLLARASIAGTFILAIVLGVSIYLMVTSLPRVADVRVYAAAVLLVGLGLCLTFFGSTAALVFARPRRTAVLGLMLHPAVTLAAVVLGLTMGATQLATSVLDSVQGIWHLLH